MGDMDVSFKEETATQDPTKRGGEPANRTKPTAKVAYMKNPRLKNMISVSDLLEIRRKSYSHLFPLIDTQTYQTKAHVSIYNTDEMLVNEELNPYFGPMPSSRTKFRTVQQPSLPSTPLADEVFDSSTSTSEDENCVLSDSEHSKHLLEDRASNLTFLDQFHTRCARLMRSEAMLNSIMLRRRSTPMVVKETIPSMSLPDLPLRVLNSRSIWVGCIIDYMVITRRLNVRLVHNGNFVEDMLGGKLFAKVSLLPGQLQKQRLTVHNLNKHSYKGIYFEKFSGPELNRMEIGVKLMLKKGLFRRAQALSEWTVPLEEVSLIGEQTAWQLFEWGS